MLHVIFRVSVLIASKIVGSANSIPPERPRNMHHLSITSILFLGPREI